MKRIVKITLIVLAVPVFLFILFYLLTMGVSVAKTVEQDPSIPHVTIDGVTFHAEAFGNPENPVVIVVHGGLGNDYRSLLSLQALTSPSDIAASKAFNFSGRFSVMVTTSPFFS